jgi:hypothetical protein
MSVIAGYTPPGSVDTDYIAAVKGAPETLKPMVGFFFNYTPFFLVLSHMFGFVEQKLLGRSRKYFFGSEKFQVSAHVLLK